MHHMIFTMKNAHFFGNSYFPSIKRFDTTFAITILLFSNHLKWNSSKVHFQGDFKQRFDLPLGCVEIFCTWFDRFLWISRFYTNSTCWAGISTVNNSVKHELKLTIWTLLHLSTVANEIVLFSFIPNQEQP